MTPWLALLILSSTSLGQEKAASGSLERARRTFAAADADRNDSLIFGELEKAGLSRRSFKKFDADASGSWSEADFLLYYENLLERAERAVGDAFQQEVARIQKRRDPAQKPAAREAKVSEKKPAKPARTSNKAVLAVPKQMKPVEKPVQVAKKQPGQPAPAVVLDPDTVPTPKAGSLPTDPEFEAYQKAEREREAAKLEAMKKPKKKPQNLLERAKEAQRRRNLAKPKGAGSKRTPG